jgi:hypothetical protein
MPEGVSGNPYRGHSFPTVIISYAVWFYYRFAASFRDVEDAMAAHGKVLVSCETVRRWCDKFATFILQAEAGGGVSAPATSGSWTKSFSTSLACGTIYGAPSIRTVS